MSQIEAWSSTIYAWYQEFKFVYFFIFKQKKFKKKKKIKFKKKINFYKLIFK
jgi:hypothetical protein